MKTRKKIRELRRKIKRKARFRILNWTLRPALKKCAKIDPDALDGLILRSCIGVDFDLGILPHFLKNFKECGVRHFRLILHTKKGADSAETKKALKIVEAANLEQVKIVIWEEPAWTVEKYKVELDRLIEDLPGDQWVLTAEADEFPEFPVSLLATFSYFKKKSLQNNNGHFLGPIRQRSKAEASSGFTICLGAVPHCQTLLRKNLLHR